MPNDNKLFFESDDDWNDIDFSDLTDEPGQSDDDLNDIQETDHAEVPEDIGDSTTEDADPNQTDNQNVEEPDNSPEPSAQEIPNQNFVLKYMGEDKEFTREEATVLAQKGMDYDRIRQRMNEISTDRDTLRTSYNEAKVKADFLDELAKGQNITTDELMLKVRAAALARDENITAEEAKEKIKLRDREDAVARKEAELQQRNESAQKEETDKQNRIKEFSSFFEAHKNDNDGKGVTPSDIPQKCFDEMRSGIPLETSYANYISQKKFESQKAEIEKRMSDFEAQAKKIKELEEKLAEKEKQFTADLQNQKNAARSVGSADTSGKPSADAAFDAAWYDDN